MYQKIKILSLLVLISAFSFNCQAQNEVVKTKTKTKKSKKDKNRKKVKLPEIDLTHWKLTTPALKGNKPLEVEYPEILDYGTNEELIPHMYNDSVRGALVFHASPTKSTTRNTKYSRSELREQMVSGNNNVNWTFKQGGTMKGKLAIDEITRDKKGKYHKVIIMQIHGRLTNEQRDLIGEDDNNAPPMLKIYWKEGKIRVKTKILKNFNATQEQLLHDGAWGDDEGFTFKEEVGFKKFTLEVKVSDGKMVIVLNNNEFKVYENMHMKKWGVFENYFKAGNYFQTRDEGAFAKVRYYSLEVRH